MSLKPTYQELQDEIINLNSKLKKATSNSQGFINSESSSDNEYFKAIVETTEDYILIIDTNLNIQFINNLGANQKKDNIIGKSIINFIPESEKKISLERYNKVIETGNPLGFNTKYINQEEETRYAECSLLPIKENNLISQIIITFKDITDRELTSHHLHKSEKFNRIITETTADAIITINQDCGILFWNKAAEIAFGYSAEEVINKKLSLIIPERYIKTNHNIISYIEKFNANTNPTTSVDLHCIRKDGTEFPIKLSSSSWVSNGKTYYTWVIRDITDILNVQNKVITNEEKYRTLFENSPVAIIEEDFSIPYRKFRELEESGIKDPKAYLLKNPELLNQLISQIEVLNVNQAALTLFQAKNKKQIFDSITQIFTEKTLVHFSKVISAIIKGKTELSDEIELLSFKKKKIHGFVKLHLSYFPNPPFLTAKVSIVDISKRVKMELKLKESEEKFKKLSNLSFEGILVHDNGIIQEANKAFCKISGYTYEEVIGKNMINVLVLKKYHSLVIDKMKLSQVDRYEIEICQKNGTIIPIEVEAKKLPSNNGNNLRVVAIRDITLSKKASHENNKLSTAVEQSSNTVIITDIKGNIEYVNPQFTRDSGYSYEEVIGKNPRILNSGKHSKHYFRSMWRAITAGNSWEGEFQNKAKNGKLYWENVHMTPIKNESGKIVNILAVKDNITERKTSEEQLSFSRKKLLESEKKFRSLFEKSAYAAVIIKNGVIRECNQAAIELLKLKSREGILNLHPAKLSPDYQPGHKKSFDLAEQMMAICLKKGNHRFEWMHTRENNTTIPIEVSLTTILNKPGKQIIHGLWRDLSTLKKGEKKLLEQNNKLQILSNTVSLKNQLLTDAKRKFQSLIAQSPVSLWEKNFKQLAILIKEKQKETSNLKAYLDNHPAFVTNCISVIEILNINSVTLKLFGVKNKLELSKLLASNFTKQSREVFKSGILALANGKTEFETEIEFVIADGSVIYTIIKMVVIDDNYNGIVSIIDITDIKKAKQKVVNTNKELIIQKEKAEESNRLKTEFLNNMSHEIRTPMNGILGFTQFLEDHNLSPEKRKHYVSIIENSANQLLQVIDDILEISKLGTKQVKVIESKVCLNTTLLELFAIFDIKARENNTPLYFIKGMKDEESTVYTDKTKLNKILSNLIENALKFTAEGFIEFGYKKKGNEIVIYVKDTGVGIAKSKFNSIFERFSQAEKGLSRKVGGLGLGLSIAKENSKLLGGDISVESTINEGTTFFITIPYKPVFHKQKTIKKEPSKPINSNAYTVLIAEDEEINYLYLEILLGGNQKYQFNILHAKNGKEALEICNESVPIDLVLMDLKMPIMDGFEATRLIKEIYPNLPIIAQTAYSTNKEKEVAISAGCDDFISKPIVKEEFNSLIHKFISQL